MMRLCIRIDRYDACMNQAVDSWNALGEIQIVPDSPSLSEDVEFRDVYRSDVGWYGLYAYNSRFSDDILLTTYYMDRIDVQERLHVVGEEVGHALGLDHSYCGQLVDPSCGSGKRASVPQRHDRADYFEPLG